MASGESSIVLDDGVTYDSFPRYAKKWARRLSLNVINRSDGLGERIWECERQGRMFWLSWDNWFPTIALEPQNHEAGKEIKTIGAEIGLTEEAEPLRQPDARQT